MPKGLFALTAFQRDLLYVAAEQDRPSGQDIKVEIEKTYDREVTHGRLYPNLDALTDAGFIDKGPVNRRSNFYETTDRGLRALEERRAWENRYFE